jgi:hypothetical protein
MNNPTAILRKIIIASIIIFLKRGGQFSARLRLPIPIPF